MAKVADVLRAGRDTICPLAIIALVWEGLGRWGVLNPTLLPPPSRILATLEGLLSPKAGPQFILGHLGESLLRLGWSMGLAIAVGGPLGILMASTPLVGASVRPLVGLLMPIPALAWTPLLMVLMGLGNRTTVTVAFIAAVIPVIYAADAGVRSIGIHHLWAARMMGASPARLFLYILLPGALEHIIPGIRIAFARAWRALIAAEMLAATNWGMGYLIVESGEYMTMETIYAAVLVISLTALLIERGLLDWIERSTVRRWRVAQ